MEPPIKISYRWSLDEMLRLNRLHMQYSPQMQKIRRGSRRSALIFIFLGIICFGAMGVTTEKWRIFTYGCGLVLLGITFLTGLPFLMRRAVLKSYSKKPDRDMVVTYQISGERLLCQSEVASSDMLWRVVSRVLRTADGFLLYVSDTQVHWLPERGFQETADLDRFASLARTRGESYKDERSQL
jgi:hypothetical protein